LRCWPGRAGRGAAKPSGRSRRRRRRITRRHAKGLTMRQAALMALMMIAAGCSATEPAVRPSGEAICSGLDPLARAHARALAVSDDEAAIETGARLLRGLDAGCGGAT